MTFYRREDYVHCSLERSSCVAETKEHANEAIVPVVQCEGNFVAIHLLDLDLPIAVILYRRWRSLWLRRESRYIRPLERSGTSPLRLLCSVLYSRPRSGATGFSSALIRSGPPIRFLPGQLHFQLQHFVDFQCLKFAGFRSRAVWC